MSSRLYKLISICYIIYKNIKNGTSHEILSIVQIFQLSYTFHQPIYKEIT